MLYCFAFKNTLLWKTFIFIILWIITKDYSKDLSQEPCNFLNVKQSRCYFKVQRFDLMNAKHLKSTGNFFSHNRAGCPPKREVSTWTQWNSCGTPGTAYRDREGWSLLWFFGVPKHWLLIEKNKLFLLLFFALFFATNHPSPATGIVPSPFNNFPLNLMNHILYLMGC